jgi:hypothetical protein
MRGAPMGLACMAHVLAQEHGLEAILRSFEVTDAILTGATQIAKEVVLDLGDVAGVRSPERISRASGRAARWSVVPWSPAFFGIHAGATTPRSCPGLVRERYSPQPHGAASETKTRGLACEGSGRIRVSWSHWRVPIVPSEPTAAPWSWAT